MERSLRLAKSAKPALQQLADPGRVVDVRLAARHGGFQLLDTFQRSVQTVPPGLTAARGQLRRVRVRLAPAALQLALVNGKPEGWRPRPNPTPAPDRPNWIEGSFRFDSYDTAIRELLALGPDIVILLPTELRTTMASIGRRLTRHHRTSPPCEE